MRRLKLKTQRELALQHTRKQKNRSIEAIYCRLCRAATDYRGAHDPLCKARSTRTAINATTGSWPWDAKGSVLHPHAAAMRGQRRRPWVHHQAEGSNYRAAAFAAAAVALLLLCAANTINYHATTTPHHDADADARPVEVTAQPVERCFDGLDHARIPGLT